MFSDILALNNNWFLFWNESALKLKFSCSYDASGSKGPPTTVVWISLIYIIDCSCVIKSSLATKHSSNLCTSLGNGLLSLKTKEGLSESVTVSNWKLTIAKFLVFVMPRMWSYP